jgi:hypothetical protein
MAEDVIKNGVFEYANGFKWYKNNVLHRVDGPAIEYSNGDEEWYFEGKLHRINGPAYISQSGKYKEWYEYGLIHRLDGPAVIFITGAVAWFYKGKNIECSSQKEFEKILGLKAFM